MRTSKTLSLSLPPELAREAERTAKREGRTRSERFREALRRYIQEQRWTDLRRFGAQQARKLGIREPVVPQKAAFDPLRSFAGFQGVELHPEL